MRVDYLLDEELDDELTARRVIITRDMNLARKRKSLRDCLKAESEGKNDNSVHIPSDPTPELNECSKRCSDLRCLLAAEPGEEEKRVLHHRLLHYAARIVRLLTASRGSPNLHGCMQSLLVEVVNEIEQGFDTLSEDQGITTRTTLSQKTLPTNNCQDEDLSGTHEPENSGETSGSNKIPPTPSNRMLQFSQNELDWIHWLESRIISLENELAKRNERVDMAIQTDPYDGYRPNPPTHRYDNNSFSTHESQNPFHSASNSRNFPPFDLPQQLSYQQNNSIPVPTVFNHNSPFAPQNHSFTSPTIQNSPNFPQSSVRNPPLARVPFNSAPYTASYQPRHSLPVSKWNIAKYSGDDQGLRLNEFLELVQALSLAEHVSERELFESAVHLFTGSALKWYMTQRSTGRLMNWEHLVFELRRTYMHPDLDALIKMKIYQRRQQKQESFHEYYFEMEKLFRTMCVQIPEHEKVAILQQNMRVDYKRQMTFIPIQDLETLVAAGQKLDALNFSAYNKVFGAEKSVQAIENNEHANRNRQKAFQPQSQQPNRPAGSFKGPPGNQNKFNRNVPPNVQPKAQNTTPNSPHTSQKPASTPTASRSSDTKSPIPGPSGNTGPHRPPVTLEQVVNGHKPPSPNTCFNCGTPGHHVVMCRQPRRLFCDNCGLHGFPTGFCPYCLKNGTRANENRRPPNQEA